MENIFNQLARKHGIPEEVVRATARAMFGDKEVLEADEAISLSRRIRREKDGQP
jgi:hypothetical protein